MKLSEKISSYVDAKQQKFIKVNNAVWNAAELGFKEYASTEAIISLLKEEGFAVETGLAGIPTAFVGSFGSGKPVIAYLGEYDALPGLSQQAGNPVKTPLVEGGSGHGCGHCALGAGALAAAVAAKDFLKEEKLSGTIRFYGTPGEESGCGKVFMTREGIFNDVDAVLAWHPADMNSTWGFSTLAVNSIYFHFKGRTAHASAAPHLGRSALDACELMNVGANYLREHIPSEARLHYAYTDVGGIAPNVVQGTASLHYMIRAPKIKQVFEIVERIHNIAKGAALMTGTEVTSEIKEGICDFVPNRVLSEIVSESMHEIGGPRFNEDDYALAAKFRETLTEQEKASSAAGLTRFFDPQTAKEVASKALNNKIAPLAFMPNVAMPASTDVGDVSYAAPTAQLSMATAAIGTGAHTWQMTAQVGCHIGHEGFLCAGRAMALAGAKLLLDPSLCEKAKAEHAQNAPDGYVCPVPDDVKPRL